MKSPRMIMLSAVAMLPLGWSTLAHIWHPLPQLRVAAERRPALAFDQYLVDRGMVTPHESVFARFSFENRGSETVEILDVTPSCGCLTPKLESKTIAPGERGRFYLEASAAGQEPGFKEFYCEVSYLDPEPQTVNLVFRVTFPERKVSVVPRAMIVYQNSRQSTPRSISVLDSRQTPLTVTAASSSSPAVQITGWEVKTDDEGASFTSVNCEIVSGLLPGKHDGLITMQTDDPDNSPLHVPFIIHISAPAATE